MIGLGSNRLSVCRRGGMSVTQAGKGGMEWLAGGRLPSWATPYSAAATAALLAQFPTQWPTIRDYGFAHPEIVGYMNAYAPEDAKIAYSLVEGIGTRKLVFNGSGYFDLGIAMNAITSLEAKMSTAAGRFAYFGSSAGSYNGFYQWDGNLWLSGSKNAGALAASDEATFTIANGTVKVQSIETAVPTYGADSLLIGKVSTVSNYSGNLRSFNVGTSSKDYKFVPYKKDGQMELLDLVSGNLATRVGTFTELIETP